VLLVVVVDARREAAVVVERGREGMWRIRR